MVRDAIYFLLPLGFAAVLSFWMGWEPAAVICLGLAAFVAFFFRDPERRVPVTDNIIVSPADGTVVRIEDIGTRKRISIFLSIFNVHVNRSPIGGRIRDVRYERGRYRPAFKHRASVENERNTLVIENQDLTVECSQIAGILARRIVCWKRPGDIVERGERIGLIRFGSRTDLLLPERVRLSVAVGDKVRGGASEIARL